MAMRYYKGEPKRMTDDQIELIKEVAGKIEDGVVNTLLLKLLYHIDWQNEHIHNVEVKLAEYNLKSFDILDSEAVYDEIR